MAAEDPQTVQQEPQETPKIPDYLASPNAVFGDEGVAWRYGRAPDYTKTRKVWAEGKLVHFFLMLRIVLLNATRHPLPSRPSHVVTWSELQ